MKKLIDFLLIPIIFLTATLTYLFPLLQGLILLPLDLLVSNYNPWYAPNTILLKNPYMQDSIVQLFPWKHLTFESLTQGIIPFWNPYQQLGTPFMANIKSMVFYPLNAFFLFGEFTAWNLLLYSQIFLSMFFAYLLGREFKLKILPSILVALSFSLSSFMIGLLEFGSDAHTMIWWPLILLFTKKYLDTTNRKYLFGLGISIALSLLGSQLQYMGYFLIFLTAFIIYYGRLMKAKLLTFLFLFISIALGVSLTALQLLPSIELFSNSHRGLLSSTQQHETFSAGLSTPDKLFRLFAPDFFGNPVSRDLTDGYIETSGYFGIIAFFFASFAMVFARKNILVKFFTGVFIVSLLLSLQGVGEILFALKIPVITSGSGGRVFTLVLFSGALLAGFGLTEFLSMKEKKTRLLSLAGFLILFGVIIAGSLATHLLTSIEVMLRSVKFAVLIVGLFGLVGIAYLYSTRWKRHTRLFETGFVVFILLLSFFDLFRFGYRFLTFSNDKFLYPEIPVTSFIKEHTQADLGRVYGFTEPELATYLNVYTIETYNPLYLLRTSQMLQALQNLPLNNLSVDNKYFLTTSGDPLKYTLDFLGAEYFVTGKDENPAIKYLGSPKFQSQLEKVYDDEKHTVYKNTTAYPRFGLYYQYKVVDDEKKELEMMTKQGVNFKDTVLLEEELPTKLEAGKGSAKLLSSDVNSQKFELQTDKPALFFISDTYYPGWKAMVNQNETKIYRANYALKAVLVPAGKSTLEFSYIPTHFNLGLTLSYVSCLLLLFLSFTPKMGQKKK